MVRRVAASAYAVVLLVATVSAGADQVDQRAQGRVAAPAQPLASGLLMCRL